MLQVTGELLRKTFRRSDIVGRFGGDEFLVLLKGIASHELLARKCRQIQTGLPQLTQQRAGVSVQLQHRRGHAAKAGGYHLCRAVPPG